MIKGHQKSNVILLTWFLPFIYSPVHGYLCYFLFGTIMHEAAMNMHLQGLNQHMMRVLRNRNFTDGGEQGV